jgi:outer membrane protein assembly factor BamB
VVCATTALLSCEPAAITAPELADDAPEGWDPSPDWPKLPADKQLGRVLGVAVDAEGRVWISHTGERDAHPEILALDPETGSVIRALDAPHVETPHALAFDDEGHLWVTDDAGNRIVVLDILDTSGTVVRTLGSD